MFSQAFVQFDFSTPTQTPSRLDDLKGKSDDFFYWLKVFIGPKLREVSTGNFHRKAPKWAKKRVKVSKIDQIRPPLHPTYCGNPPILSSELLWEFIWLNYIHIWIPTAAPMKELVDSHSRSDAEIAKKWIPTAGRMKELMDSHSSSDDRIGGFPQ